MTDIDLDKLEAMAIDIGDLYAEDNEWPIVTVSGKRWHVENVAKQSSDAIKSLIASAREAAAEIERLKVRLAKWEPMAFAGAGSTFEPHMRCSKHLAALGRPYPRTCLVCRLGPCRDEIVPHEANPPQPQKGEGG